MKDRRAEDRAVRPPAVFVDDLCAAVDGVLDQGLQVGNPGRVGQRRDANPGRPGHPDRDLGRLSGEAADERLADLVMDKQNLQGRAALAVEGQGSQQAFVDGGLDVGIGQDDGGVFRPQPEKGSEAVFFGVEIDQAVGHGQRADEGEDIDSAAFHQRLEESPAVAGEDLDRSGGKAARERVKEKVENQDADPRRLKDHGVAGKQGGDNQAECFEQRIIIRAGAEGDAAGLVPDKADDAFFALEGPVGPLPFPGDVDQATHRIDRPVEFVLELGMGLGNFPHQDPDDRSFKSGHAGGKILQGTDAFLQRRGCPGAVAVGEGLAGGG